jgi:hypothetical protein
MSLDRRNLFTTADPVSTGSPPAALDPGSHARDAPEITLNKVGDQAWGHLRNETVNDFRG